MKTVNPLRVNEEEIFRQYMLAQTEPKVKEDSPAESFSENDSTDRTIRLADIPPRPERKPLKPPPVPDRKPETISPTRKGNELLDFIGQLESSDNCNMIDE